MKNLFILLLMLIGFNVSAQLATVDAGANSQLAKIITASAKSTSVQSSMNSFLSKSFTTLGDMKKKAGDLLSLTKEYQDALSAVNSIIANSEQVQHLFNSQKQIVTLYTGSVYKYDRYLPKSVANRYHGTLKGGLKESFNILKKADIVLKPNFVKMNDNERFQQLDKINTEMDELRSQMQAYINIHTRFGETIRTNPEAAKEAAKQFN